MVTCAVPGCVSSKKKNPQDYSFHQFPIDPVIREKWVRMLNRPNWTPHKYSTICSKHFDAQCYAVITGQKRRKLRSGSVPTICMPVKLPHPRQATTYQYRDIEPVPSTSASTGVQVASSTEWTPRKKMKMVKTISNLKRKIMDKEKKLKNVRAQNRRNELKIVKLSHVVQELKSRPSLRNDLSTVMESCPNDLLTHLVDRVNNKNNKVLYLVGS